LIAKVSQKYRIWLQRLAIAYGLFCGLLYFQQQRLMFFPAAELKHTPALYQSPFEEIWLPIAGHPTDRIHGWWIPAAKPDAPVILYFHHNAVNIGANVSQAQQLRQLGYAIFLIDYRGFGRSQGDFPTEPQLYEDAQTAWNYLTQARSIPASRIVIYGHSFGGAIATDLASKHPEAAALIVQSSFTSIRDMTKRFGIYWVLPVELLLRQRFESEQKLRSIKMPVLIITGTDDIQIPVEMGERLYQAAAGKKELIVVQGGGHDNHLSAANQNRVQVFIQQVAGAL
jgi:uncharacterized protein